MKLSLDWLCDYVDLKSIPFEEIQKKITLSVCEIEEIEELKDDKILVIDNKSITHRPDLWSHFGFARELAAQFDLPINYSPYEEKISFQDKSNLTILENSNVHSYFACVIENIEVKSSLPKFVERLEKCGIRSISNIVDVSNYVMLEMGQPTHFFDRDTLESNVINIEKGYNVKIQTLDEVERTLTEEIVVISNNKKPIAIAGIIGGKYTEVSQKTKVLVLESAVFKREDIRAGIKKLGLRTESSMRYEKGLDSSMSYPVLVRTLQLLKENGCANLKAFEPVGFVTEPNFQRKLQVQYEFLHKKLGKKFPDSQICNILERLGFEISPIQGGIEVIVPKYRQNYDITIAEDLVEEVGRSIGYSEISTVPLKMDIVPALLQEERNLERTVKKILAFELDFQEVYNYSFASKEDIEFEENSHLALKIVNQMPPEQTYLRTSTYPSILQSLIKNIDRFEECRIFEFGRVYFREGSEKKFFTLAIHKNRKQETLLEIENDLLELRANLETLFTRLNLTNIRLQKLEKNYFHPFSSLSFWHENYILAELGILHPKFQKKLGFKKRVLLAKIYFEPLLEVYKNRKQVFEFKVPSVFPQANIDISLVLDEKSSTADFANLVYEQNIQELENIYVHSIFRGEPLEKNKKSVTYRAELFTYTQTFTQAKIHEITEKLVSLAKENGFVLR